jgi:hypothetical protein
VKVFGVVNVPLRRVIDVYVSEDEAELALSESSRTSRALGGGRRDLCASS